MKILISKDADFDIDKIFEYSISEFGRKRAEIYYTGLRNKLDNIANNLVAFSKYDHIKDELRRTNYESHAIFYRISDDSAVILRVLHQSMNPIKHLDND